MSAIKIENWLLKEQIFLDDPLQKEFPHGAAYLMGVFNTDIRILSILMQDKLKGFEYLRTIDHMLTELQPRWNPSECYYRGVDIFEVNSKVVDAKEVYKNQDKRILLCAAQISQTIMQIMNGNKNK